MGGRTFAELSVETNFPPYLKNILGGLFWNLCRNRSVFISHDVPLKRN